MNPPRAVLLYNSLHGLGFGDIEVRGKSLPTKVEDEVRPAYRNRLQEAATKWNPTSYLLFSGSQAKIFIDVEAQYAREAARAHAETLIEALSKAGVPFDDDAFRKALDDTKVLLEKHSGYSYRKVMGHFNVASMPPGAAKGVEQDIDNEMQHIHDSILGLLRVKLQEAVITTRYFQVGTCVEL